MKVLLVDDHPAIRLGMRSLLSTADDVEVIGESGEPKRALELVRDLDPDLVILDLRLRGESSGVELCRSIKSLSEPPKVLIHTAYNMAEDISSCQLSGAESYVHKSEDPATLLEAIRGTCEGHERWFLGEGAEGARSRLWSAAERAGLTAKEKEIFALLIKRRTNPEIAKALYLSPLTVKTHVANVLRKMNLKNRRDIC